MRYYGLFQALIWISPKLAWNFLHQMHSHLMSLKTIQIDFNHWLGLSELTWQWLPLAVWEQHPSQCHHTQGGLAALGCRSYGLQIMSKTICVLFCLISYFQLSLGQGGKTSCRWHPRHNYHSPQPRRRHQDQVWSRRSWQWWSRCRHPDGKKHPLVRIVTMLHRPALLLLTWERMLLRLVWGQGAKLFQWMLNFPDAQLNPTKLSSLEF